jgi:hypothetical protein
MNERYKELIKYQIEILRALFVIFIADTTGIISLISKGFLTTRERLFIVTGFFVNFGGVIMAYKLDRKIKSEINKLH